MWLALLTKYWWLVPFTVLMVCIAYFRIDRDHVQAKLTVLQAELVAKDQAAHLAALEADKRTSDAYQKWQESQADNDRLNNALANRLRQYTKDRVHYTTIAGPAPAADVPAIIATDIDSTLADLVAACGNDANRLKGLQEWAAALTP
jgi:hypothetical protein